MPDQSPHLTAVLVFVEQAWKKLLISATVVHQTRLGAEASAVAAAFEGRLGVGRDEAFP